MAVGSYYTDQGEITEDSYFWKWPSPVQYTTYIKFDIGSVPAGETIGSALLYMYCQYIVGTGGSGIDVWHVPTQAFSEVDDWTTVKGYGTGTKVSISNPWTASGDLAFIDIKNIFNDSYSPGSDYLVIKLRTSDYGDSAVALKGGVASWIQIGDTTVGSKTGWIDRISTTEYPYLGIWYGTEAAGDAFSVYPTQTMTMVDSVSTVEGTGHSQTITGLLTMVESIGTTLTQPGTGSPTTAGWGAGSLVFLSGEQLTSEIIYLGGSTLSNIGFDFEGSNYTNLKLEASPDSGLNWEAADAGSVEKYPFTNTGSALQVRLTENAGQTIILTKYGANYGLN